MGFSKYLNEMAFHVSNDKMTDLILKPRTKGQQKLAPEERRKYEKYFKLVQSAEVETLKKFFKITETQEVYKYATEALQYTSKDIFVVNVLNGFFAINDKEKAEYSALPQRFRTKLEASPKFYFIKRYVPSDNGPVNGSSAGAYKNRASEWASIVGVSKDVKTADDTGDMLWRALKPSLFPIGWAHTVTETGALLKKGLKINPENYNLYIDSDNDGAPFTNEIRQIAKALDFKTDAFSTYDAVMIKKSSEKKILADLLTVINEADKIIAIEMLIEKIHKLYDSKDLFLVSLKQIKKGKPGKFEVLNKRDSVVPLFGIFDTKKSELFIQKFAGKGRGMGNRATIFVHDKELPNNPMGIWVTTNGIGAERKKGNAGHGAVKNYMSTTPTKYTGGDYTKKYKKFIEGKEEMPKKDLEKVIGQIRKYSSLLTKQKGQVLIQQVQDAAISSDRKDRHFVAVVISVLNTYEILLKHPEYVNEIIVSGNTIGKHNPVIIKIS